MGSQETDEEEVKHFLKEFKMRELQDVEAPETQKLEQGYLGDDENIQDVFATVERRRLGREGLFYLA